MKCTFPEDFKFGAAVWAQGTEGAYLQDGKALTTMEQYAIDHPLRMQQGIPPFETLDWYNKPDECIELVKELELPSYRTSINWARLIPDGKNVNQKAVAFYRHMFEGLKKAGVDVWCVLYWFEMPVLYENQGGFSNRDMIEDFVFYAQTAFDLFSDVVSIWYIYNEPIVDIEMKYLRDTSYPNEIDMNKAYQSVYNMIVAHAKVVKAFKAGKYPDTKIGSVLNLSKVYSRSSNKFDLAAVNYFDILHNSIFSDPLLGGKLPSESLAFLKEQGIEIKTEAEDAQLIKENTINVLGINHYAPTRIKARESLPNPNAPLIPEAFYDPYEMPGRKMNKYRGWEIYPDALFDTLKELSEKYPEAEFYITENGMGVQEESRFRNEKGQIEDDYRIEYLRDYLSAVSKALEAGINVKGYHVWSFIDLWSPSNQFLNCYGLIEYSPTEKKVKGLKKSGEWYREVIRSKSFEF